MARARRGFKARRRRNKIIKLAKGYHFDRRSKFRHTKPTVERALDYAYTARRLLKRDMRQLWIVRIGAAVKTLGTSYSRFIHDLKSNNVQLNRKMLAEIAVRDSQGFQSIYEATR